MAAELPRLLLGTIVRRPYVFAFLACFVGFALRHMGWRRTLTFAIPTFAIAYAAEWSSTRNGFPFGPYAYDDATRAQELWLSNVPFWDTISFVFLSYFSLVLAAAVRTPPAARRALAPWPALRAPGTAMLGGLLMTVLDVVIDPVTLQGEKWFLGRIYAYPWDGFWFGVTAANFAGWFVVGLATQWTFQRLLALPWCGRPWRPVGPRFAWAALGVYAGILGFMLVVTVGIGDLRLAAASAAVTAAALTALVRGLRGPRRERIVVCAATATEAGACRRGIDAARTRGLEVLRTGVGPARAAAALSRRLGEPPRPALIVSSGFAGALSPGLARHSPATARALLDESGVALPLPPGQLWLAPGAAPCELIAASAVVRADERRARAGAAALVDMESLALARLADAAGIPFAVLRIVTDTPAAPFPPFVNRIGAALSAHRPRSRVAHAAGAISGALRSPGPALAFVRASLEARRALREAWRLRAGALEAQTSAQEAAPAWRPADDPAVPAPRTAARRTGEEAR